MRLLSAQAPDSCTVKFTAPRRSAVHTYSRGFKKCSARRFSMHKHKNSHGRGATLPKHARGDRSTAAPTGTSISLRSYAWCQTAHVVGHITRGFWTRKHQFPAQERATSEHSWRRRLARNCERLIEAMSRLLLGTSSNLLKRN